MPADYARGVAARGCPRLLPRVRRGTPSASFPADVGAPPFHSQVQPDFVLVVGDDQTDEPAFAELAEWRARHPALAKDAYACTVGRKPSRAPLFVDDQPSVVGLLDALKWASLRANKSASVEAGLSDLGNAAHVGNVGRLGGAQYGAIGGAGAPNGGGLGGGAQTPPPTYPRISASGSLDGAIMGATDLGPSAAGGGAAVPCAYMAPSQAGAPPPILPSQRPQRPAQSHLLAPPSPPSSLPPHLAAGVGPLPPHDPYQQHFHPPRPAPTASLALDAAALASSGCPFIQAPEQAAAASLLQEIRMQDEPPASSVVLVATASVALLLALRGTLQLRVKKRVLVLLVAAAFAVPRWRNAILRLADRLVA